MLTFHLVPLLAASKKSSVCSHPPRHNVRPARQRKFHANFAIANDILPSAVEPSRAPVHRQHTMDYRVEQRSQLQSLQSAPIRVVQMSTPLRHRPHTRHHRRDMPTPCLALRPTRHQEHHPQIMDDIKPIQIIQGLLQLIGNTSTPLRYQHSLTWPWKTYNWR